MSNTEGGLAHVASRLGQSKRRHHAQGGRLFGGQSAVLVAILAMSPLLAACQSRSPLASFKAAGSIDQAYVLGARPGARLTLMSPAGKQVATGTADRLGSYIFQQVTPGSGYEVSSGGRQTPRFRVLSTSFKPPESLYASQKMHAGVNYIRMRDGIYLAATLRLPPGETLADGPFPTVIEYSGYQIAAPGNLLDGLLKPPTSATAKALLPDTATAVGSIIAPELGFATVSLQMRGTGCSGGAFDLFGLDTTYDGYDAVEIVAHQSWVLHHKVGLVGISFSGISQLFVAGTDPPGLAAIAPMSVTDDLYSTGYPGGIYNDGFAASWLAQRVQAAQPAPGGLPYAEVLIKEGDKQCLADQALHLETPNIKQLLVQGTYRDPAIYDVRSPAAWAAHIKVPVFIAGAFQDEETGGQWSSSILPALAHDKNVWATLVNGTHIDSLGPAILSRWLEFLDVFVAQEVPKEPSAIGLASLLYKEITGASAEAVPAVRFTGAPSVAAARADFIRDDPRVRVLMDNGGASGDVGGMQPEWEMDFSTWPPSQAVATAFDLGADGTLKAGSATLPGSTVSFNPNPAARPATDLPTGNAWAALPPYDWTPVTGRNGLGFISPPLAHDVTVAGPAALYLQVESTAADTDLQATISEVRPDGEEMFMTTGELRAGDRFLDKSESTLLHPVPTYLKQDASPLPTARYSTVAIPLNPFAYTFRAGSRIRITISTPGGDRPAWAFATFKTGGKVVDTVRLGGASPSVLELPVISGVVPPDAQPACPSLRGQPCRKYVPAGNGG
ncbi:MAG: CocE/NonD family hydrolase [Acidimicrobiales bacterium]